MKRLCGMSKHTLKNCLDRGTNIKVKERKRMAVLQREQLRIKGWLKKDLYQLRNIKDKKTKVERQEKLELMKCIDKIAIKYSFLGSRKVRE